MLTNQPTNPDDTKHQSIHTTEGIGHIFPFFSHMERLSGERNPINKANMDLSYPFLDSSSSSSSSSRKNANTFQAMNLHPELLNGLNRMGYRTPTPVQRKALPIALASLDIVCMARTGSGKTCVFLLPMIQRLKEHTMNSGVRGIVLSPTRELAVQTFRFGRDMSKFTSLRVASVIGGDPLEPQFEALSNHPDVLIGTPGRLMHHLREISTLKLNRVEYLVFDEADRLFEMGFAEQLNEIVSRCPEERQTLLFSATMPKQLVQFSRAGLRDPQLVRLDTDAKMSEDLRIGFFYTRSNEKIAALLYLARRIIPASHQTIVFTATRHHSEFLHLLFERIGISSTVVYGSMDQVARTHNLGLFRDSKVNYLIVTDLAARGIDVPLLNNVINFHFPTSPKLFVHRCGRAARQGRPGYAFSLVDPDELGYLYDVHAFLGKDQVECTFNSNELRHLYGDTGKPGICPSNAYTLILWTPKEVHTGLLPQDVLDEENDYLKGALTEDEQLKNMFRVSENGMQQYKRTRTEATKDSIKKSKKCIKESRIRSIHPVIIGEDPQHCHEGVVEKANFVRMLQTFRPKETVFESGIGTGTTSEAAKNLRKKGAKEGKGIEIMKALRKATASGLERTKPKVSIKEDVLEDDESDIEDEFTKEIGYSGNDWSEFTKDVPDEDEYVSANGKIGNNEDVCGSEDHGYDSDDNRSIGNMSVDTYTGERSRRLSKADRKNLKRSNLSVVEYKAHLANTEMKIEGVKIEQSGNKNKTAKKSGFKDKHYMTYGTEDEVHNFIEESMQPQSGLKNSEINSAASLENALLDLRPSEALAEDRNKKIMRWDSKKRKFVKQTLKEMSEARGAKKVRTESGVSSSNQSSKKAAGEMYAKWQKKTKREVGGVETEDNGPRPNFKVNNKVPEELRTTEQIRKILKKREDMKLKNMPKEKRKKIEKANREKRTQMQNNKKRFMPTKGSSKIRVIMRT